MATLKAMFKLFDGYSSTINKIVSGTDKATGSVLKASNNTDKFNNSLRNTGASASVASSGLSKLVGAVVTLASAKKGMDLTDSYTNTAARLKMINDESQTQLELQNKIFAAADRARGSYTDMASAVAKMNLLAGDSFKSNDEAIGFTELLQKSLKVSGAGKSEQDSAFLQLSQAMAAGKLQGDEFRSVMENAPMVANAIASYMGKSKGELKELSSKGAITADIIKGAMFAAADDINDKFATMPMTFADVWTKIKNTGNQAFGEVFEKLNQALNSDMGQTAINNLIGLIYAAADACDVLIDKIDFVAKNLDMILPIVLGLAGAWAIYNATAGFAWLTTLKNVGAMVLKAAADWAEYAAIFALIWAQEGLNAALAACPVTWIITAIVLLIAVFYAGVAAVNHFAGTSISATGLIVGALFWAGSVIANIFIGIWNFLIGLAVDLTNLFISFAEFLANCFNNPILAIMRLFADLANFVIGVLQSIASAIDTIFGSNLSGVVGGWSSAVDSFKGALTDDKTITYDRITKSDLQFNRLNNGDAYSKGYNIGSGLEDKISNLFSGAISDFGKNEIDFSKFATSGNPATIKGTGKGGAVKVENEDDPEWLRMLANRDFVARIATNTLAPNLNVVFSGPITKEADVNGIARHLDNMLKEQLSIATEGAYQ